MNTDNLVESASMSTSIELNQNKERQVNGDLDTNISCSTAFADSK